jgi:hypothetical protein
MLKSIDAKLLEASLVKLDPNRKAPLRKALIELENLKKQGKGVITHMGSSAFNCKSNFLTILESQG